MPVIDEQSREDNPCQSCVDEYEQLVNERDKGPLTQVSVSAERITKLHGIMCDIDPKHFRISAILPEVPQDPTVFHQEVLQHWLRQHNVLQKAEVRVSGTGLHVLLWLSAPVVFENEEERLQWAGIIKTVQACLPIDPDQPGITSLTRPVGSVNSKNNAVVTRLHPGELIPRDELLNLHQDMMSRYFKTVFQILIGSSPVSPCPFCGQDDSRLSALDKCGRCYGSCGTIKLDQLYDIFLAPRGEGAKK